MKMLVEYIGVSVARPILGRVRARFIGSVAPEVQMNSSGVTGASAATSPRAPSTAAALPKPAFP